MAELESHYERARRWKSVSLEMREVLQWLLETPTVDVPPILLVQARKALSRYREAVAVAEEGKSGD